MNCYSYPAYREIVADLKEKLTAIREDLQEGDDAYPNLQEVIATYW